MERERLPETDEQLAQDALRKEQTATQLAAIALERLWRHQERERGLLQ